MAYNPNAFTATQPDPLAAQVAELRQLKSFLPKHNQEFADSLAAALDKWHRLSPKQAHWVGVLLERARAAQKVDARTAQGQLQAMGIASQLVGTLGDVSAQPGHPSSTAPGASFQPPAQLEPGFLRVLELFARAKSAGLGFPRIRMVAASGQKVVVSQYSDGHPTYAKNLAVSDGKPYGTRKFFGRIDLTGAFYRTSKCTDEVLSQVQTLGRDPVAEAKIQGRRTGACMFCARELTTDESVTVGYGPICAAKFGLPWGDNPVSQNVTVQLEELSNVPQT